MEKIVDRRDVAQARFINIRTDHATRELAKAVARATNDETIARWFRRHLRRDAARLGLLDSAA